MLFPCGYMMRHATAVNAIGGTAAGESTVRCWDLLDPAKRRITINAEINAIAYGTFCIY
jgi:hypothetical protein